MNPEAPSSKVLSFNALEFGAALVETQKLGEQDWRIALEVSRQQGQTPIRTLLELGLISEDSLATALALAVGCERWTAETETGVLHSATPHAFMRVTGIAVVERTAADGESSPTRIVCADPSDAESLRSIARSVQGAFEVVVGAFGEIHRFIDRSETRDSEQGPTDAFSMDVTSELSHLKDMASEAPVIRFFNQAIENAATRGASDLHLERFDQAVSMRFRVDGMLIERPAPPGSMYEALLCRVKIMAGLDIAERRRAQDGRIRMRLRGRMVDLRVSLIPTMYGQDLAIRIQDRQSLAKTTMEDLGFPEEQRRWLHDVAHRANGILLITGPTGSGKSTTLYSLLKTLRAKERKIVTIEDPVEYAMEGVNQIQVNPAIDLTFSGTLRHILRHDPDVILIGEIRDHETAEMAFQAALTGHMVLSTLHTNDVPGAFVRLIDMGVEPYLVNAAIEGVASQRLVRRLCHECRNAAGKRDSCAVCAGIGYRGRVAVMEHADLSADVKRAIVDGVDERRVRDLLASTGFVSLRDRVLSLVKEGVTDEMEARRVLGSGSDA